jgi:AhpD family alkylhydroperoxidase
MATRLNYAKAHPQTYQAMIALEAVVKKSGLEPRLVDLIKLRASQINGCAFCIDMHTKELKADGESDERIYLLDAWRESPFYSQRERAALDWTESLTLISVDHVPDEVYENARKQFSEEELVKLTLAVVAINGWNRFGIAFRVPPAGNKPIRHVEGAVS